MNKIVSKQFFPFGFSFQTKFQSDFQRKYKVFVAKTNQNNNGESKWKTHLKMKNKNKKSILYVGKIYACCALKCLLFAHIRENSLDLLFESTL